MADRRPAQDTVCLAVSLGWLLAELSGTDRVVAVLVSAAGFLGLSWAGVRATLGRAVRQAEHAMWDAEVVAAIGKAATVIPDHDGSGPAAAELADAGMAPRPACRG